MIAEAAEELPAFHDPVSGRLFDRFADRRVVLLGEGSHGNNGSEKPLQCFPTWMWRNTDIQALIEWLREHNAGIAMADLAGFYGSTSTTCRDRSAPSSTISIASIRMRPNGHASDTGA